MLIYPTFLCWYLQRNGKGMSVFDFYTFPACSLYIETVYDMSTIICCSYDKGGHLFLPSYIMRTHGVKDQKDAINSVPRKQLRKVFEVY
jgi:hypothetical protein